MFNKILICTLGLVLITGCDQTTQTSATEKQTSKESKNQAAEPIATNKTETKVEVDKEAKPAQHRKSNTKGKVVETINGGGYTYAKVEDGIGGHVWVAGKETTLKAGDKVSWRDYAVMRNFQSKALNRSFDTLLFISQFVKPDQAGGNSTAGKVLSVTAGGGYNYIEAENAGNTTWLAAPISKVQRGDNISWASGAKMRNFKAKSLGKTFPEIVFVAGVNVTNSATN